MAFPEDTAALYAFKQNKQVKDSSRDSTDEPTASPNRLTQLHPTGADKSSSSKCFKGQRLTNLAQIQNKHHT